MHLFGHRRPWESLAATRRGLPEGYGAQPPPHGQSVLPAAGQGWHVCPAHPKRGDAGGWAVRAACRRQPIMPY